MIRRYLLGGIIGCALGACASNQISTDAPHSAGDADKVKVALALINSQNVDEHIVAGGISGTLSAHEKNALRFACGAQSDWEMPPQRPEGIQAALPPLVVGVLLNLATGLVNKFVDYGVDRVSKAFAEELAKYTAAYEASVTFNIFEDAANSEGTLAAPVVRYPCFRFTRATWDTAEDGWTTQLDVIGQFAFNALEDGTVLPQLMTRILRVYYAEPIVESETVPVSKNGMREDTRPVALSLTLDLTSKWWGPEEFGSADLFVNSEIFVKKFDFFSPEGEKSPPYLSQVNIIDNPTYNSAIPQTGPSKMYDPSQAWESASGGMPLLTSAPWIDDDRRIGMVDLNITAAEAGQPDFALEKLAALFEENKENLAEIVKVKFGTAIQELLE